MRFHLSVILVSLVSASCHSHQSPGGANEHLHSKSFDDLVFAFDNPARDAWQKPDEVMKQLGPLRGRTVFEIGSGTGYFTFRLEKAGARVVAGDVDQRFLDLIDRRRKERGIPDGRIETRRMPYDSPSLNRAEADVVFAVNTYHHIENRVPYFKLVREGLKADGRIVVVDFKNVESPFGPPVSMRLAAWDVVDELRQSGFTRVEVDDSLLPYQYIVTAYR